MNSTPMPIFKNRIAAGRKLATLLQRSGAGEKALILALPRGGVPVAAQVAEHLGQPFDVLTVRKLGVPGHEEYAMGAIASGGVRFLNHQAISQLGIGRHEVDAVTRRETAELKRRERVFRGNRSSPRIAGQTVIVVDDGIATGSTMFAAIRLLHQLKARRIVVAVPVAPPDTVRRLIQEADDVVVCAQPEPFGAVGHWYEDFGQTSDAEVRTLLAAQSQWNSPLC